MLCSDALLADLETTRALSGDVTLGDNYNNDDDDDAETGTTMYYQQEELRQSSLYSDAHGRSSPTPPPLPPLPSRELLDTVQASTVCVVYNSVVL